MAAGLQLQRCVVAQTGKHSASVIFLHGSGDTGQGLRAWVRDVLKQDLAFPHIRVIYPTAPARPYTPMRGALSHVWFDRYKISWDCPEHLESVEAMCSTLDAVVQQEVRAGVPKHRLLIGGFSMGGAMALHLVSKFHPDVAGVFALSSFLNKDSVVFQMVQAGPRQSLPELFQCHGTADELVPHDWAEMTVARLRDAGVSVTFHSFPGVQHQLSRAELEKLRSWIIKKLPQEDPPVRD
ncbi:lysophospholipase-like protein 1 [Scleropages formosus]|uniref:palmitoyl-protein hydrolase n=1 Tax=Scleropages formosus TaxID=113540 RepID=A0A8C9RHS3_SCLFO|nr:lysophospholipase-like protein 1 [Scleropages formosus]XP_018612415.1 lysophospholipase-like protein 1 [Scleropages formosus]